MELQQQHRGSDHTMDRRQKQNNIKKQNKVSMYTFQNSNTLNTLKETEQYLQEVRKHYATKNRIIKTEYSNGTITYEQI